MLIELFIIFFLLGITSLAYSINLTGENPEKSKKSRPFRNAFLMAALSFVLFGPLTVAAFNIQVVSAGAVIDVIQPGVGWFIYMFQTLSFIWLLYFAFYNFNEWKGLNGR